MSYDDPGFKTRLYEKVFADWDMEPPLEDRDFVHLFQILIDTPNVKYKADSIEAEEKLWHLTRWVVEQQPGFSKDIPKIFKLDGKEVEIPMKVGQLSIGQNIVLRQLLDKGKYLNQFIGMAIAIYLQPLVDRTKFKKVRALELYAEIAERPISETYPLGFFLLNHVSKPGQKSLNVWQKILSNPIETLKRMLPIWQESIDLNRMPIYRQ